MDGWNPFQAVSDRWFFLPALKSAQLHSRRAPTYVYTLEYEGKFGYMDIDMAEDLANGMPKPHGMLHPRNLTSLS